MWMRGGTSKGGYFLADELPADAAARDAFLLRVMGSPDKRQIDGMGGADPLTSKVAVVRKSAREGIDVDYLFLQVFVDQPIVTDAQNCGNILAGVAPFAIERGLLEARDGATDVRIFMENTGQVAMATVATPSGRVTYEGAARIDGVPGTAAAIPIVFKDTAGSSCGALLPTGRAVDVIDGIEATLIDNGMPCVVMRAADLGITGEEEPKALEANEELRRKLESIRLKAGPLMNLGDVAEKSVPKMTMVSAAPPRRHDFNPHLHSASLSRVDRGARRGLRRHGVPVAGEPRRRAGQDGRRRGARPRAYLVDRASDRRDDCHRHLGREWRGQARGDPAHRAQALRRRGVRRLTRDARPLRRMAFARGPAGSGSRGGGRRGTRARASRASSASP